jgi:acetate kinase
VDAGARGGPPGRPGLDLGDLNVLVVNAGSTSLKLHLVDGDDRARAVESLDVDADLVAHRIVHGGPHHRDPVVIDAAVHDAIRDLRALAPLHNAPALEALEQAQRALPGRPHVAVFDTAFHATIPEDASTYALPSMWREEWGVRRYGFHGLSVQWASERVRVPRLVVCHLGGGSSVTAVLDGRSVDTTMGFSPLEGVPMTTRSGSVDPGALLYVLRSHRLDTDGLDHALNVESGLAGLAGGSGEMLDLERRDDAAAALALSVFTLRVAAAVAAMAVSTGGLDALVFTAGIGEGSALVRERVCARLAFLGVELDPALNRSAGPDSDVGAAGSGVRVAVVHAREELVAARAARRALARP